MKLCWIVLVVLNLFSQRVLQIQAHFFHINLRVVVLSLLFLGAGFRFCI
jgi:hypothetical protein